MLNNYICALDIGSSKIAATVAKIKRKHIASIFYESLPSVGIKKGATINAIDLMGSIEKVLKNLKIKSATNIKSIYINISGQDIFTKHSHAIIPLTERGNKVITLSDVQKVNAQARILGQGLEEEIVHSIPFSYTIDSRNNVINPLGLYGHRLEIDLYLICARLSSMQSIVSLINRAGYEINDLFFSGIATAYAIFNNKEFKEGVNIICDIGSDTTELVIFKDGLINDIEILSLGGDDLTLELTCALNIPFDLAEEVKRSYGIIGESASLKEDKEILLKKSQSYKPIRQKLVTQILTSKTKLMCQVIKDALDKNVDCTQVNNFISIGRTVLLEGFLETLENTLGTPVRLGRITNPDIISCINKDPALVGERYLNYITSLGIICGAFNKELPRILPQHQASNKNPLQRLISKFKEVYQEYF